MMLYFEDQNTELPKNETPLQNSEMNCDLNSSAPPFLSYPKVAPKP